jgi:hypothetical protein
LVLVGRIYRRKARLDHPQFLELEQLLILLQLAELSLHLVVVLVVQQRMDYRVAAAVAAVETAERERQGHPVKVAQEGMASQEVLARLAAAVALAELAQLELGLILLAELVDLE